MTTFTSTREYDLFGPWVDEVPGPSDIPRLYRDHAIDFASARLVLKVPRNIDRRDATPDMDLYDHLLIAGPDALQVLSRATPTRKRGPAGSSTYTSREVTYTDIVAIHDSVNLLDATLTITGRDASVVSVHYNGSAAKPITALVDVVRSTFKAGHPLDAAPISARAPLGERDAALMVDFKNAARRLPGLTPLAWHERRTLRPLQAGLAGLARRVALVGSRATLHGAILGADDVAIEAFGRREWIVRGRAPELSSGRLVVPTATLDAVEFSAHPDYAGVAAVTFKSGAARTTMHVPEDSDALAVLTGAFSNG